MAKFLSQIKAEVSELDEGSEEARARRAKRFSDKKKHDRQDEELEGLYDGSLELVNEEEHQSDSHKVHDLVLHADNDYQLHRSSEIPIKKNLEKKHKKGIYDREKAKKLWGYHADRAAQSAHKASGEHGKWFHHYPPHVRKAAAAHWEEHHHAEMADGHYHHLHEQVSPHDEEQLEEGKHPFGAKLHKGTYYFPSHESAHAFATHHGYPTHRIIQYGKGHAVQGGESGDYAGPHGLKIGDWRPGHSHPVTPMKEGLDEGIKNKMSPHDAHEFLEKHGGRHSDFHALPSEHQMAMRDKSYEVGFQHNGKRANGSRARYFHAALQRHAARATTPYKGGTNEQVLLHPEEQLNEVSDHELMTRPDLHAAREHFKKGVEHSKAHQEKLGHALAKYGDHGSYISGAGREHFPDHVKDELRHHAHAVTKHNDAGMEARPKGVRMNTMRQLGRAVARKHGHGFYGFTA